MPRHGAQLAVVDFAEGDKQYQEHKRWQKLLKYRVGSSGKPIECGDEGKHQVNRYARGNSNG